MGNLDPADYHRITALVTESSGLRLLKHHRSDWVAAIERTMQRMGLKSVDELAARLRQGDPQLDSLVDSMVVQETYFFRHPQQFELIRTRILPQLRASSPRGQQLLAWSAGCATGEEIYSLAIVLEEEGYTEAATLLATDISRSALDRARRAVFDSWSLRDASVDFIDRYFERQGGNRERFILKERIRRRPVFDYDNLAIEPPSIRIGLCDLIMCRNVLIYLEPAAVHRVALRFYAALNEGGWLVTGPGDPILTSVPFEIVVTEAGLVYRKTPTRARRPARKSLEQEPPGPKPPPAAKPGNAVEPTPLSHRLPPARSSVPARKPPLAAARTAESPRRRANPRASTGASSALADDVERRLRDAREALSRGKYALAAELTADVKNSPETCALHARALVNSGRFADAEAALTEALSRHRFAVELHFLNAVLLRSVNRDIEAVQAARHVLFLDRTLVAAHLLLAVIEHRLGRLENARLSCRNALSLASARPEDEILPLSEERTAKQLAKAASSQLALIERELQSGTGRRKRDNGLAPT